MSLRNKYWRFDYTYDNEGNRFSMAVEPAWGSETGTIDYSYDLIYQMTGAQGPGFSSYPDARFTYDSIGRRVADACGGGNGELSGERLHSPLGS